MPWQASDDDTPVAPGVRNRSSPLYSTLRAMATKLDRAGLEPTPCPPAAL